MKEIYCITNCPRANGRKNGDLWVSFNGKIITVMDPAPKDWRGKTFTVEEFSKEIKHLNKLKDIFNR